MRILGTLARQTVILEKKPTDTATIRNTARRAHDKGRWTEEKNGSAPVAMCHDSYFSLASTAYREVDQGGWAHLRSSMVRVSTCPPATNW